MDEAFVAAETEDPEAVARRIQLDSEAARRLVGHSNSGRSAEERSDPSTSIKTRSTTRLPTCVSAQPGSSVCLPGCASLGWRKPSCPYLFR